MRRSDGSVAFALNELDRNSQCKPEGNFDCTESILLRSVINTKIRGFSLQLSASHCADIPRPSRPHLLTLHHFSNQLDFRSNELCDYDLTHVIPTPNRIAF